MNIFSLHVKKTTYMWKFEIEYVWMTRNIYLYMDTNARETKFFSKIQKKILNLSGMLLLPQINSFRVNLWYLWNLSIYMHITIPVVFMKMLTLTEGDVWWDLVRLSFSSLPASSSVWETRPDYQSFFVYKKLQQLGWNELAEDSSKTPSIQWIARAKITQKIAL